MLSGCCCSLEINSPGVKPGPRKGTLPISQSIDRSHFAHIHRINVDGSDPEAQALLEMMSRTIKAAERQGTIVITAAGNDALDLDQGTLVSTPCEQAHVCGDDAPALAVELRRGRETKTARCTGDDDTAHQDFSCGAQDAPSFSGLSFGLQWILVDHLPHGLVASFKSTLDEALDAGLLLHVIDASDPGFERQREVTDKVLAEIDARPYEVQLALRSPQVSSVHVLPEVRVYASEARSGVR